MALDKSAWSYELWGSGSARVLADAIVHCIAKALFRSQVTRAPSGSAWCSNSFSLRSE
jgi:hypothetical protein